MSDRDARLGCYDRLGRQVLGDDVVDQPPPDIASQAEADAKVEATVPAAQKAEAVSETPSLPDDLGGAEFEERSASGRFQSRGLVTSCEKGRDKRWYFHFENGQVWRESNTSKRRFRECRFFVTITRDGFGYKMQIDGKKSKIRVGRRE